LIKKSKDLEELEPKTMEIEEETNDEEDSRIIQSDYLKKLYSILNKGTDKI